MAVARNASRKARQRSQDPAESLINLSNERLTGLFRWTLLIFAVILNNLNPAAGYDQGRINAILAAAVELLVDGHGRIAGVGHKR